MKKLICLALVTVFVAPIALAIDMTADEVMAKFMTCISCKPWAEYPELGPNTRYNIFDTDTGFIATFMVSDEKFAPAMKECHEKCLVTRAEAMKLSPEEAKDKLCPFCEGMFKLGARDDVKIKEMDAAMGQVVLVSSDTEEGVKAAHAYAATAREIDALLTEAAPKMPEEKK